MASADNIAAPSEESHAARALAEAAELVGQGRILDALELLTVANRTQRDSRLERRLVTLRRDAFEQIAHSEGRAAWPPEFDDPFPLEEGLVEVPASELTGRLIGGAVQHHGCLLVRSLLDESVARHFVAVIDEAFSAQQQWRDAFRAGTRVAEIGELFVPFQPSSTFPVQHLNYGRNREDFCRVLAVDSPGALFDLTNTFERAGLRALLTEYLGDRPVASVTKCVLRRLPAKQSVGWHQESFYLGEGVRALNVWVALTPAGDSAPGLELLPKRLRHDIGNRSGEDQKTMMSAHLTSDEVEQVGEGTATVTPTFRPGDALLFDEYLVHRTSVTPEMNRARYSIESWFFAPNGFPLAFGPMVF